MISNLLIVIVVFLFLSSSFSLKQTSEERARETLAQMTFDEKVILL